MELARWAEIPQSPACLHMRFDSSSPSGPITDALCANCGLCCDGSLLADVELAGRREADRMEALGLEVEEGDDEGRDLCLLPLPCAALRGTRCSIYPHRPETCRTFECRLLKDALAGRVSLAEARGVIEETRSLARRLGELVEAVGEEEGGGTLAERVHEAMGAVAEPEIRKEQRERFAVFEALVRERFLDD